MATIGRPEDIERVIPRGSQPIATIRNAGAIGEAVASVGQGMASDLQRLLDYQGRKSRAEFVSANAKYGASNFEFIEEYDDRDKHADTTFGEWEEDYNKRSRDKLAEFAKTISNPRLKEQFQDAHELTISKGSSLIRRKARAAQKGFKLEELNDAMEVNKQRVVKGSDNPGDAAKALQEIEAMVESFEENDWLDENNTVVKDFERDAGRAWIDYLPPEQRYEAWNSDEAKRLFTIDEIAVGLRETGTAVLAQKAQDLSDKWMLAGQSDTDVQTILRNMNDEPLRTEAAARWSYDLAANKRAELIDNRVVQDEIYDDLMAGKSLDKVSDPSHDAVVQVKNAAGNVVWSQTTSEANIDKVKLYARNSLQFKDDSKYSIEGVTREAAFIDKDKLRSLPLDMEKPLRVIAAQNVTQVPVFSDDETVKTLRLAHQQGDYAEVDRIFTTSRHLLNKEDRKVWQTANIEGGLPDEYRVLNNAQVSMVKAMTGAGETYVKTTDDNTRLAEIELQRWYQNEQKLSTEGKYPTQKQVNDYKDFLMLEPDYHPLQMSLPDTGPIYGMTELERNRFAAVHRAYQQKYPGEVIPIEMIERAYAKKWNTN